MYSSFANEINSCGNQQKLHEAKISYIASGKELIDLSMINPDQAPPRILVDKLVEASVKGGSHRYSVSRGIKKLRSAFAEKYLRDFGVELDPEKNICITMGTKDALVNCLAVISVYSKTVLLPSPTYPAHLSAVELTGLKPHFYNICCSEDQMLSEIKQQVEEHDCKILVTNFPNNPTGQAVSSGFYKKLAEILNPYNVIVISDFVYGEMSFSGKAQTSLLSVFKEYQLLLECYSLSKAYSVPGWRIAAMAGNEKIVGHLVRLKSHIDYGIFLPLQTAACSALQNPSIAVENAMRYKKRHKLLSGSLKKLGWQVFPSSAGAALWARIPEELRAEFKDSMSLCLALLEDKGVLFTPGIIFGREFDDYVRIALVTTEEKLYEISKALAGFQQAALNSDAQKIREKSPKQNAA